MGEKVRFSLRESLKGVLHSRRRAESLEVLIIGVDAGHFLASLATFPVGVADTLAWIILGFCFITDGSCLYGPARRQGKVGAVFWI